MLPDYCQKIAGKHEKLVILKNKFQIWDTKVICTSL